VTTSADTTLMLSSFSLRACFIHAVDGTFNMTVGSDMSRAVRCAMWQSTGRLLNVPAMSSCSRGKAARCRRPS
jgi:hypothetical protein